MGLHVFGISDQIRGYVLILHGIRDSVVNSPISFQSVSIAKIIIWAFGNQKALIPNRADGAGFREWCYSDVHVLNADSRIGGDSFQIMTGGHTLSMKSSWSFFRTLVVFGGFFAESLSPAIWTSQAPSSKYSRLVTSICSHVVLLKINLCVSWLPRNDCFF